MSKSDHGNIPESSVAPSITSVHIKYLFHSSPFFPGQFLFKPPHCYGNQS